MKRLTICIGVGLGLMATLALLWSLSGPSQAVRADSLVVCPAGPPACDYGSLQAAVDAAGDGDLIQVVTGVYTGVHQRGGVTQVVQVNKSLTIRGGYPLTQGTVFDPHAYPVTLDAQGQGRVLYAAAPTPGRSISLTLEGLRFIGGDATGMGGAPQGDAGGGMYVSNATLTLKNSQVSSNTASGTGSSNGGGLYIKSSAATLSDNIISLNDAYSVGGGLYISASVVLFNHNVISSNQALSVGGLFQSESEATFSGNTFSSNGATFGCGGLFLSSGHATFNNNVVSFNYSDESGGVCLSGNNATLKNNFIVSNAGVFGGGLRISDSHATLSGNSILSNTTPAILGGNGGGLHIRDSVITLTANIISFNKSGCCVGGGLSVSDSTIRLDRNTVLSNTAVWGGGIHLDSTDATLVNNVIADNRAEIQGSGLYVHLSGDDSRLLHNTIARNGSSALTAGSGLYVTGLAHTLSLTNTILVSHAVGITVTAGNMAVLRGTLWGNASDWGGAGVINTSTNNVNVWGNPDFVNPGSGDYHIGPGSAAINAGLEAGLSLDFDYEPRPYQAPDLGADEYWPPGALERLYLPIVLCR